MKPPSLKRSSGFERWRNGFRQFDAISVVTDCGLDKCPVVPDAERCCNIDGIAELLDEHFILVEGANGLIDPDVLVKTLISSLSFMARRMFCKRTLRKTTGFGQKFESQAVLKHKRERGRNGVK